MFTLNCKGKLLIIDKPIVMGIINATPDSFYKGNINDNMVQLAEKLITQGATILDIGGQSTKPNSERISADEELKRVISIIEKISINFPETVISIDTYQSKVAQFAVEAGASIVNDISAGNMDADMITTVAKLKVPYVCMHMKGIPETMQNNASYNNVNAEILNFFIEKIDVCKKAGIVDIILDPGFGFGKTIEHNFSLLKKLSIFKMLEKIILVGLSRKSLIYKTLNTSAEFALNGTTTLNSFALINGANILRVHDVKEAKETIDLFSKYSRAN